MKKNQLIENYNAGIIPVLNHSDERTLYPHQIEAIRKLNDAHQEDFFKGILVLPTGGGKTMTAIRWVLKDIIGNNKKVLWIAHRHQLLNQAFETLSSNANRQVLPYRKHFSYRIISGMHDKSVNISEDDDFIIASKDSLNYGKEYLKKWVRANQNNIVLIIDEAHHAAAKSYRQLIEILEQENNQWFQMLGLTATPDRTCEKERGILKEIFSDDIVYGIDLKTLVARKILSDPIFEELNTKINIADELTDRDIKRILALDHLPPNIAESIVKNAERNNMIVGHYLKNKKKYGQMLLFAIDINHAIALSGVFKSRGVKAHFVVSSIVDENTGVLISAKENTKTIQKFKDEEIQVLINVNILTEGTDLPNVQSVFLTRPTTSTILMTQMIGRGLRGVASGGTEKAYIVSFIDDWQDKINWVNPKKLIKMEDSQVDLRTSSRRYVYNIISIEKIEEFAKMMDDSIDTSALEKLDFIERVPVGLYSFSILIPSDDEEEYSKNCDIIVYDSFKQAYEDFINDLDLIFQKHDLEDKEFLDDSEMSSLCDYIENDYFEGYYNPINYKAEDIKDVLRYYALKSLKPEYLAFHERESLNLGKLADQIWSKNLGIQEQYSFINDLWGNDKSFWRIYFGQNKKLFLNQLNLEILKIANPETYPSRTTNIVHEKIAMEKLTLAEIKERDPFYWRQLFNSIYEDAKDADGFYHSAKSDYKSKHKIAFQIDHIVPMSKGGLTVKENLQLLTKKENMQKGDLLLLAEEAIDGETDKAEEFEVEENLESNLENSSSDGQLFYEKSQELHEKKEYRKALKEINKAISINDQKSEFYGQRGVYYCELNQKRNAKKDFEMAIRLDENNASQYFNLAFTLYLENKFIESNKIYLDYIVLVPNDPKGFHNIAVNFERLEENDKAIEYYEKALRIDGSHKLSETNLKDLKKRNIGKNRIQMTREKWRNIDWE